MNDIFRAPSIRVPGLLGDDALREQLKQLADANNDAQAGNVPSSAVDMADRVQRDFLDLPLRRLATQAMPGPAGNLTRALSSGVAALTPSPQPENARRAAQDAAMNLRSDMLAQGEGGAMGQALGSVLLGGGPVGALLSERGPLAGLAELTPEEAQADADERLEAAKAAEAATRSHAQTREQLRNLTDEQAADMGFPVAPGTDSETMREAREEAQIADAERVKRAEAETDEAQKVAETPELQARTAWWMDAARSAVRSTSGVATGTLKGVVLPFELALGDGERSDVRAWIETVDKAVEKLLPPDKARAKDFITELSAGGGSMVGFMLGGYVARAVGMPASVATTFLGAMQGGASQVEDAERFDASNVQKIIAYLAGGALGATEAVPINRMLLRAEQATGGLISRILRNGTHGSVEEFLQEVTQSLGADVVAQLTYDENREIDVKGAVRQGLIGGIVGGLAGTAATALETSGAVPVRPTETSEAPTDPNQQTQLIEAFIADTASRMAVVTERMEAAEAAGVLSPVETTETLQPEPGLLADTAPVDTLQPVTPVEIAREIKTELAGSPAPRTVLAERLAERLDRPAVYVTPTVEAAGGPVPSPNEDGNIILRHASAQELSVIDPAFFGTGPLQGAERARVVGSNAAQRSYYGLQGPQAAVTRREYTQLSAEERAAAKELGIPARAVQAELERRYGQQQRRAGYRGEGLGPFIHEVAVKPDELYNAEADPLGIRASLPTDVPAGERATLYETAIRDAGFAGVYYPQSELGQTAIMFDRRTPSRVFDERYGTTTDQIAKPEDFRTDPLSAFQKTGWAIITATQEAQGPALSAENVEANRKLRERLRRDGVEFEEVSGAYRGEPQGESFLIFAPEDYAIRLGRQYKQESILTRDGLLYSDGRVTPVNPAATVLGEAAQAQDFFSTLPSGEAFSLGLDFDATIDRNIVTVDPNTIQLEPTELEPLPGLTTGRPVESVVKAARAYALSRGLPIRRQATYVRADPERGARIAAAYEAMEHAPDDPAVAAAYQAMIDETLAQYQFVKATGLKIEAIEPGQPDPYPEGPKQVLDDLERGHLWFFPTDQGFGTLTEAEASNPLLAPTNETLNGRTLLANDVFRIVHDFFGHGIEGSGFGARGEENAWQSHMRLYSEAALPAVTSETRGQNSWVNFGPYGEQNRSNQRETVYADQKTGIMPEWTWREGVADEFNPENLDLYAAQTATAITGDTWSSDEIVATAAGWAEAIANPESTHPLAPQLREAADAFANISAEDAGLALRQLMEAVNGDGTDSSGLAAGAAGAAGEGTAAAGRADAGARQRAGAEPDADAASSAEGLAEVAELLLGQRVPVRDSGLPLFPDRTDQSFDRWFEGSAVVDDNGEPLVVYHGTPRPGFRQFDPGATGVTSVLFSEIETHRQGFYFAESESFANTFAEQARGRGGGEVMPVFLSIKNPLDVRESLNTSVDAVEAVMRRAMEIDPEINNPDFVVGRVGRDDFWEALDTAEGGDVFVQAARELGYDGVRMYEPNHETGESESVWVAFDPTQIKSAAENTGAYSPTDPDIYAATASRRNAYAAEQARPQQGIPGAPDAAQDDVSLTAISKQFIKLLDLTTRQGRFTLRGSNVMGQYSRKQNVVRLRTFNDLSTLVHEGGHAVQAAAGPALKAFIRANETQLMDAARKLYGGDVSAMNRETTVAEGFAEFFRVYTLNRKYAETHYATLSQGFSDVLDQTAPELRDGLAATGEAFAAWLQLPSAQLVRNMVVSGERPTALNEAIADLQEGGFGTWFHERARAALTASVNRYAGLNDVVNDILNLGQENAGRAIDLKRAEDPRVLIRLATNNSSRAMVQTTDGVMGYRSTTPMTRGLREALLRSHGLGPDQNLRAIDPVIQRDFAAYLIALRGIDEYRRFADGKIERPPLAATLGDLTNTVQELNAKYPNDFAEAAQIVHEYGMGLWQKAYDAGLMTKQTYKDGLERQFYVPLQRDMSDRSVAFSDISGTTAAKPVKRFRGSDRDIIDPMDALMDKTFALERVIAENEVKLALAQLADRAGTAGALVERVPAHQLMGSEYSVQEIARQLTKDDTISEADAQDLMNILEASIEEGNRVALFRSQQALARGENIVFFWEKGKLAALQIKDGDVGVDVVNTLNAVGTENMPLFVGLIAQSTTLFRSAITLWPDFLIVNYIRDQFSAWVLTDVGYRPFATGIRGMGDELRQRDWARQYNATMGIMGGMNTATLHQARVSRDIDALRAKGYLPRVFSERGVVGAIKGLARVTELSETGTRLGIFRKTFERAKKDGLTDWEASIEASYNATDYIDFGLNGSRMLLWRRTIPFLNAQLQGLYKMLRTLGGDEVRQRQGLRFVLGAYFKDLNKLDLSRTERQALNTGRKAWLKMVSLGLIGALLHAAFRDDPDYQETSEYLRATGWVIPLGDGKIAYIPKPFELAILSNFFERALESAGGDDEAMSRFLRGAAMNLVPPMSAPAISTAVEQMANHDFFSGREIVPDYMRALAPELQYNNYTTELAKEIGAITGWSPMRIDHVLSGMGASAYRDLTSMYNMTDPNRPSSDKTEWPITRRFVRDARRGSVSAQDFWKFASTTDGVLRRAELTYRTLLEGGQVRAADEYLDTLDNDAKAYALLNVNFKADAKRLNPFYRGRQLTTIVSAMRRELTSELGVESTLKFDQPIMLSPTEKYEVDRALSEYARREMRNTLVYMQTPGWSDKKPLDTQSTLELLRAIEPRIADEFERRVAKAKVYSANVVQDYWPEVRDRLLRDRENTFLKDILSVAKVMR